MGINEFIGLVLFVVCYAVGLYYLISAVIDLLGSKDIIIKYLGNVDLNNEKSLYMGLASGLAERFGLGIRLTQVCLFILWVNNPTLVLLLYVTLHALVKVANKKYELAQEDGLDGSVGVTYNGDTPDIVTAVEDPSDSNSYRDTVVGQVNEELSKITDSKIDTSKTSIEVSDDLEAQIDEFYKKNRTNKDDSESDNNV